MSHEEAGLSLLLNFPFGGPSVLELPLSSLWWVHWGRPWHLPLRPSSMMRVKLHQLSAEAQPGQTEASGGGVIYVLTIHQERLFIPNGISAPRMSRSSSCTTLSDLYLF